MIQLDNSIHSFRPSQFGSISSLLEREDTVERDTLMIACSDHGTAPDNVSFADPDRFFILQRLAASVTAPNRLGEDHEIRFGFDNYPFNHVILCGHFGCGVIRNWLKPDDSSANDGSLPSAFRDDFRSKVMTTVDKAYPRMDGDERLKTMICEYLLFQLENLLSYESVQERLTSGVSQMHAWVVDDSTARVFQFDPEANSFSVL